MQLNCYHFYRHFKANDFSGVINDKLGSYLASLVEAAGKFSMLHLCKHSKFLINIENTQSTHEEIL